jgi:hypothetical protein
MVRHADQGRNHGQKSAFADIKVFLLLFRKTKEEAFFFEKKNQKTFICSVLLPPWVG